MVDQLVGAAAYGLRHPTEAQVPPRDAETFLSFSCRVRIPPILSHLPALDGKRMVRPGVGVGVEVRVEGEVGGWEGEKRWGKKDSVVAGAWR